MTRTGYLECERRWVYWLLILVAGWYGAYAFALRGGVFCNAQTANVVLFAMAVGNGRWLNAACLLLPISSYLFGSFLSEWMGKSVKRLNLLRWDTILVALEAGMVVFLALMPPSWPDQVCQVTLNFACAMQFNTYRQVEGVPAATTFVTNHIRQIGSNLAKLARHSEDDALRRRVRTCRTDTRGDDAVHADHEAGAAVLHGGARRPAGQGRTAVRKPSAAPCGADVDRGRDLRRALARRDGGLRGDRG